MRRRDFWLRILVFSLALSSVASGADPLQIWPSQPIALKNGELEKRIEALDESRKDIEQLNWNRLDPLLPAIRFQKVFLEILSGAAPEKWISEIEEFANARTSGPVGEGLSEVARAWLARWEMLEIDRALRRFYRTHVRFPATFSEIENDLPTNLRKDPWGGTWAYDSRAPQGFKRLSGQRYQIGPEKYPQLGTLAEATRNRLSPARDWIITPHLTGANRALEFRATRPGSPAAVLQAGGKIEDCALLFIGEKWALMAGVDQLFAVAF